ncbi:MAG: hypothetical protein IT431_03820 [Phycisphaerales bacterium]|nr:hypothetical protein [Phycisphaerales bacterium]
MQRDTKNLFRRVLGLCTAMTCASSAQPCAPGWSPDPSAPGFIGEITALVVHDDGSGPALYAGGDFAEIGGSPANHIARWNGSAWEQVGDGVAAAINDLAVFDWGEGPRLIASGTLYLTGRSSLAFWDGQAWLAVPGTPNTWTGWMGVSEVTGAAELFVGMPVTGYIRRWDGSTWREVGDGLFTVPQAFAEFDDGDGEALFAAGGLAALYKFDGSDWAAIDGDFSINGVVEALAVFDDGSGEALYLGGQFSRVPHLLDALRVASWDGGTWRQVGAGFDGPVHDLTVFDDGSGPALYAAGSFTHSGGTPVSRIARWDGAAWSALGSGVDGPVTAMLSIPSPGAAGLPDGVFVAGEFGHAGGLDAPSLAVWAGCACAPDFNADGSVNTLDVLAFLGAWGADDPGADFNADGVINTLDVLAFLSAWSLGC